MYSSFNFIITMFVILSLTSCLQLHQSPSEQLITKTFRSLKFYNNSLFFTTSDRKSFGYLNSSKKGSIEQLYILSDEQKIFDQFQTTNDIVTIGNIKNKTLIHYNALQRSMEYDERFLKQNFSQLHGFKQVSNKCYIIIQNSVLFYTLTNPNLTIPTWSLTKTLLSQLSLNPGISQSYISLNYFPSPSQSQRIFILSKATVQSQKRKQLLICFKWFQGEQQQVDGACSTEDNLQVRDFSITKAWAYLTIGPKTYVYDNELKMKTKLIQHPTQFVNGHVVTQDHLTYQFNSNELVYYRLVENYKNDDIRMTVSPTHLNIQLREKMFARILKLQNSQPVGVWAQQLSQSSIKLVVQYDSGDLHGFKITKSQTSTSIDYLFRITASKLEQVEKQQVDKDNQLQEADLKASSGQQAQIIQL